MLKQIEDLSIEDLRMFAFKLNKYEREKIGQFTTGENGTYTTEHSNSIQLIPDSPTRENPSFSNEEYQTAKQKKPRKQTRLRSKEENKVAIENKFDILPEESIEVEANEGVKTESIDTSTRKTGQPIRIPPIVMKNKQ
ncbi:hypothetical protein ILUMI_26573 [Ignelater luminosus]|uniref:Uncharacterized protein n=1 Tax=Ignelater luminosus TaxID=2038154 RepID=A0A8K0FZ01_IGNLU|nr:hypothetical protein ILUMI_26573 [Ignelater luminosus]